MLRQHRWQVALALAGALFIGLFLLLVSDRAFRVEPARGGQFVEAVVGRPATFNPLLAQTDVEVDLARLLFAGLTRADPSTGAIEPGLAERWAISPDRRVYTFTLRSDALWHDGRPVTAEDVVFTAALVTNSAIPDGQKTRLAEAWRDAQVEALDERRVQVRLSEPYAPFLSAAALSILPAHILAEVPPAEITQHPFSVRSPIGAGPFRLRQPDGIEGDTIRLERFDGHWAAGARAPYLDQLILRSFPSLEAAGEALGQQSVQGLGGAPAALPAALGAESQALSHSAAQAGLALVYLNPAESIFASHAVRQALSLALDRDGICGDPSLLDGQCMPAASPIPAGSWAHDASIAVPDFDPEAAGRILDEAGWIDSDANGVRDRDGQPLSFALSVRGDDPLLIEVAERLRRDWTMIGVGVDVAPIPPTSLNTTLRDRAFSALLMRWDLRADDPDPYGLWHSSQVDPPGQNLAGFRDSEADRVLVEARQADPEDIAGRQSLYRDFQRIFAEQLPALTLYHPIYHYIVANAGVGGVQLPRLIVEPADRFRTLPDWFVQTERVFGDAGEP